jgi:hypothetical protein
MYCKWLSDPGVEIMAELTEMKTVAVVGHLFLTLPQIHY